MDEWTIPHPMAMVVWLVTSMQKFFMFQAISFALKAQNNKPNSYPVISLKKQVASLKGLHPG